MNFPSRLTQVFILASLLSSCAHQTLGPKIDARSGLNTQALVKRFGYPKCTVSVALSQEQAVASAELVGAPHINQRKDWAELTNLMIPGDELPMSGAVHIGVLEASILLGYSVTGI
jgi:hypothetical protein